MRAVLLTSIVFASSLLSACGERSQTAGGGRTDVAPYQGAENRYVAPDWKAGDKANWEQALKARMLYSQNEYSRFGVSNK